MATFLELKNDVAALVIDLPPTVQSAVPTLINEAIRSMQRTYNYRAMEASTTFVTSPGVLALGSIANFKEYRDKGPYMLRKLSKAKRYIPALGPDVDLAVLSDPDVPVTPEFLMNSVDVNTGLWTFTLAPYPDNLSDWADGNYRIIVPTYLYTANLVNDSDQNWFTLNARDYITYKAAAEGFARDWDNDGMAIWLQRAKEKLDEIKKADKTSRLSGVDSLVPMWQGAAQPQVRR